MGYQYVDNTNRQGKLAERQRYEEVMDYRKFIDTLYILLKLAWGDDWGTLVIKRPTTSDSKDVDMPKIVYSLKEKSPGQIGKNTQELVPRQRQTVTVTNEETGEKHTLQVYGQIMDCYIEFIVYEENNQKAMVLSQKFIETMNKYKGLFQKKGMQDMYFEKEYERSANEVSKDSVASRGILYRVRLEELHEKNQSLIAELSLTMDTLYDSLAKEGSLPSQQI